MGIIVETVSQYKAGWYETARNLFRSRNTQRARADQQAQQAEECRQENQRLHRELRQSKESHAQTRQLLLQQRQENEQLRRKIITLPTDLPLPNHTFGLRMMSVCMNLSKHIGFRPAETAITMIFKWLGIDASRIGMPKYVVTDGASELRESVDVLENNGKKPILLRDLKHVAANIFEKLIGRNARFQLYLSKLGQTRSQVQQTEPGHFTPSSQKPKARFMNLGPALRWGQMVSYHLRHHRSLSRQGIKARRMNETSGRSAQQRRLHQSACHPSHADHRLDRRSGSHKSVMRVRQPNEHMGE